MRLHNYSFINSFNIYYRFTLRKVLSQVLVKRKECPLVIKFIFNGEYKQINMQSFSSDCKCKKYMFEAVILKRWYMCVNHCEARNKIMQITGGRVLSLRQSQQQIQLIFKQIFFLHLYNSLVFGDLRFLNLFCKNITWLFQDDTIYGRKKKRKPTWVSLWMTFKAVFMPLCWYILEQ